MRLKIRELSCACCGGRLNRTNTSACPDCEALLHVACWEHDCAGETPEAAPASGSGELSSPRRKVRGWRVGAAVAAALLVGVPVGYLAAEDDRQVVVVTLPAEEEESGALVEALAATRVAAAEQLTQSAVARYNAREFDGALVDLQRALEHDPTASRARLYLGLTYYELGCPQVAIGHYTWLIETQPDDSLSYLAFYNRAWNRQLVGDSAGALVDAERAAELAPGDERFARFMALLHDLAGDREQASSQLRAAMELDPDAARPRLWFAAYTGDRYGLAGITSEDTLGKTARALLGGLPAEDVIAWAHLHDPQRVGEVQFLLGLFAERQSDLASARLHYGQCLEHGGPGEVERSWARSRLALLAGE